ncbi:phytoene desaturase family protein [Paenibacillus mucilaginosus]|uniref:phytoene desaturase family protein n=1 Tax=Paenibacillus mucilaginosus TaxID=61624 RepID=UPI0030836314
MERKEVHAMKKRPQGIVVGGGIGGLVAAILLASRGYPITLLEQNEALGGKLQPMQLGAYAFDFGPSTITMPWVFESVFREAGQPLDPELSFRKLEVNSRNGFADGTTVDLSADPLRMEEQLCSFRAEDRQGFLSLSDGSGADLPDGGGTVLLPLVLRMAGLRLPAARSRLPVRASVPRDGCLPPALFPRSAALGDDEPLRHLCRLLTI